MHFSHPPFSNVNAVFARRAQQTSRHLTAEVVLDIDAVRGERHEQAKRGASWVRAYQAPVAQAGRMWCPTYHCASRAIYEKG